MTTLRRIVISISLLIGYLENAISFTSNLIVPSLLSNVVHCHVDSKQRSWEGSGQHLKAMGNPVDDVRKELVLEEYACPIKRKRLKRSFKNDGEYLFTTQRNIRDYEWTHDEVEDMMESLLSLQQETNDEKSLELGLVIIMPAYLSEKKQEEIGVSSVIYDVHDGQQRIVTLCLLFAALRDAMSQWGRDYDKYSESMANSIFPNELDCKDVCRIEIRGSGGKVLRNILSKQDEYGEATRRVKLPRGGELRQLSKSEKLIVSHYKYLLDRVKDLGPDGAIRLSKNILNFTFLLVGIPTNIQIARNLVMGFSKGKNIEPIDEFKGLVCFGSIANETLQDETLKKWNALAEEVGRENLQSACILYAQIFLKRALKKNGEVDLMEDFLKYYLQRHNELNEAIFFSERIVPAARVLKAFRNGEVRPRESHTGNKSNIAFLRSIASLPKAKHIELVILYFLMEPKRDQPYAIDKGLSSKLFQVERLGLWLLLGSSTPSTRLKRCFDIMSEYQSNLDNGRVSRNMALDLSSEEKTEVRSGLKERPLGNSSSSRLAKALLNRLNDFENAETSHSHVSVETLTGKLELEHVLPQKYYNVDSWNNWNSDDAEEWMHRLGNLALLNQAANVKIGNGSFEIKRAYLSSSPYPLTRRVSKCNCWNKEEVKLNHEYILSLAEKLWDLGVNDELDLY